MSVVAKELKVACATKEGQEATGSREEGAQDDGQEQERRQEDWLQVEQGEEGRGGQRGEGERDPCAPLARSPGWLPRLLEA